MNKLRDSTKAKDDEITRNLVGLAKTRPDIFGMYTFYGFFLSKTDLHTTLILILLPPLLT